MFGHEDQQAQQNDGNAPADGGNMPTPPPPNNGGDDTQNDAQGAPALNSDDSSQNYIMDPPTSLPTPTDDVAASGGLNDGSSAPAPSDNDNSSSSAPAGSDDLLDIKQQALQQLTPLVDHLEQTPDEKFRTTMMMIQASDNDSLIKEAYAAAQQIPDEKTRAQALLDIVNEINYFTTKNQAPDQAQAA